MNDDQKARPDSRRPASRYSIFVGIAFVIVIVVATANTLRNRDDGILGTGQTDRGDPLPEFALPDHTGKMTRLSDLRGQRVVLWFYPKARTPG